MADVPFAVTNTGDVTGRGAYCGAPTIARCPVIYKQAHNTFYDLVKTW